MASGALDIKPAKARRAAQADSQLASEVRELCVSKEHSLRGAIACIDKGSRGIALVIDTQGRLLDTITDGDVRRALLAGIALDAPVRALCALKEKFAIPKPVTALLGTDSAGLLKLMQAKSIRQIPLLDKAQRLTGLVTLEDLLPSEDTCLDLHAIVMVGGYGTRLRPLTNQLPKAMLPIGEQPLLELILHQIHQAGIRKVSLTTHYRADLIRKHFGDGKTFGLSIDYIHEEDPLGTAGALSHVHSEQDLLVVNGDILTHVDFRALWTFHQEHAADMTVAVRQHEFKVPYGVVDTDGVHVAGILEKPTIKHFVNAGIYLLSQSVLEHVPTQRKFDMTDLISFLIMENRPVVSFPIREYWMDIGHIENYQQAIQDYLEQGEL